MIDIFLFVIVIALLADILFRERQYDKHIKFLEEKIVQANPQTYWAEKNEGKKPVPNEMVKENSDEVSLNEIPMMEFTDRDFKIELEGDSETPQEARIRKQ